MVPLKDRARWVLAGWINDGEVMTERIMAALAGAVADEREACAKLCEDRADHVPVIGDSAAHQLAAEIRARQ